MERKQIETIITLISNSYPNHGFDSKKISVWLMMLADSDYEATKNLVIKHIKTNKFPPTIGDIHVQEHVNPLDEHTKFIEGEREKVRKELADPELRKRHEEADARLKSLMMKLQLDSEVYEDDYI